MDSLAPHSCLELQSMLILYLLPVLLAAVCGTQAYAFLGERWGALGWVGAAIILAASVTTQLGGAMEENDNDKGDKGPKEAKATS